MKAMFAYDHKFYRGEDGNYYSNGQFPYRIWQRYLEVFDELVVAVRVRPALPGENIEKLDLSSGPKVSFLEIPSISGPVAMFAARGVAKRMLTDALKDCDALIIRGSAIGILASQIAMRLNIPWAIEVVSCTFDSLWNYGTWQGKVYAPVADYLSRQWIKKAPYAIYVTQEFLQRRYPCKGKAIGCSDVQINRSAEDVLLKRKAVIMNGRRPFKIGLIGSLASKYKGIETAMQALRRLQGQLESIELHILGGGDSGQWKRLAEKLGVADQTVFCGTLPSGDAVNSWLDQIDLYIQPSYAEGLPRALLEAMNRGCPALGSSAGGIPELLEAGCIHRPGDSKNLALLIKKAIESKRWQLEHAERNFVEATRYDQGILNQIRRDFWNDFAQYCQVVKGRNLNLMPAQ